MSAVNSPTKPSVQTVQNEPTVFTGTIDRAAMGFSLLCLAHCLAIPLLATIAPLVLPHNQGIHWVFLIIALPLTSFGLWKGVTIHGDYKILALGLFGLSAMALGALELYGEQNATYTTITGVAMIFNAHALNIWRQSQVRKRQHRS